MNPIIDLPEEKPPTRNLRKSLRVCIVYAVGFVLLMAIVLFRPESGHSQIIAAIAGFIYLATVILSPLGLYYIIKAWRIKEGSGLKRVVHTIVHSFFLLLLVALIASLVIGRTLYSAQ